MKAYKHLQETINRLNELITELKIAESEIKNAIKYNIEYRGIGLVIDVLKMQDKRDELEQEYNDFKKSL